MPSQAELRRYWNFVDVNISGIDRVGELLAQGRTEEARDHLISCARAVWQNRWRSRRVYSLRRLGEELDPDRFPALAPIAQALRREEPGAARAFLDYLRARKGPDASPFLGEPAPPPPGFDIANPWHCYSFSLWQAWMATKDVRYKDALDGRLALYFDPVTVITWHETTGHWPRLVISALRHGGIEDETLCHLILFGLYHAEQCNATTHLSDPPQTSVGGNHMLAWISAWLTFTVLFPEFRRTPVLQADALARLDDELSLQVMPDGSMIEGAPGYQNCCLYGAACFLEQARHFGFEIPPRAREAWRAMMRFNIGVMKPDWRIPMFGDSQDDYTPSFAKSLLPFEEDPTFHWVGTEGRTGHPPAYTSHAAPSIGYYALRNGWKPDSLCLVFDGGRFGQAHQHEDKLNFEVLAFGRPFVIDVGVYTYDECWFREWSVLAQAHNTILVDGAGQCRWRQDREHWFGRTPLENRWDTGPTWDIVEASFDGPWERDIGSVRTRRRIAFHKGDPPFWWITDTIEGEGAHEICTLFHFAWDLPELRDLPARGGVRTCVPGGPDMALLSLATPHRPAGFRMTRFRGQMDPPRGWHSPERGRLEPAWEVHGTMQGPLPLRQDWLLLPWRAGFPVDPEATLDLDKNSLSLSIAPRTYPVRLPEA